MLPIPLTDTPASAPAVASPPSGGGAHRAAPAMAFAALMDAGLVKATLVAAAAKTDAATSSGLDEASAAAASGDEGSAPGAAGTVTPKTIDVRQRTHAGQPLRMVRIDAATVLPAWMPTTKATASLPLDGSVDSASGDDDDAGDVALDAVGQLLTQTPAPPVAAIPAGVDLQLLATQIPIPGDEDAPSDHDTSPQQTEAVPTANVADQGTAKSRFALGHMPAVTQVAPAPHAGKSHGVRMAMAHAPEHAAVHASTNSVFDQSLADAQPIDLQGADSVGAEAQATDESPLDQLSSTATTDRAENGLDAAKSGRSAVRDFARSLSAVTRPAPSAAAAAGTSTAPAAAATIQPSSTRDTAVAQADMPRKLSPSAEAAARRSDAATIPSIRFAETPNTDTGAQGGSEDASRDQRQQPSASAATRLMAGVVPAAGDAHASTQAHAVAPVFTVPTTATTSTTPTVAPTEAAAPASAPTIDVQNIDRLVQSMHVSAKSGVMEATVRLRPEYLGDITIQLRVDGTGVSAVVRAESSGVRQWLESNEQTIRNGLAEHGLELTRFIVDPDGHQQSQQDAQPDRDEQRRAAFRRRQQSAAAQRFEITV